MTGKSRGKGSWIGLLQGVHRHRADHPEHAERLQKIEAENEGDHPVGLLEDDVGDALFGFFREIGGRANRAIRKSPLQKIISPLFRNLHPPEANSRGEFSRFPRLN